MHPPTIDHPTTVPDWIAQRVHTYYWDHDWNCAVTTLRVLSEHFDLPLCEHVLDAALGLHGAGGYRAQCGLVEGALMFIGLIGKRENQPDEQIVQTCYDYAQAFEARFGSLLCRELRPEGFSPDNPHHLCEPLTGQAIVFDIQFIDALAEAWLQQSK